MHAFVGRLCSPSASRLAVFAAIAVLAAGCSSESSRFSEGPFSNPYGSRTAYRPANADVTGSVPAQRPQQTARIESRPLPQVQNAQPSYQQPSYQQPSYQQPSSQASTGAGMAGGGRGIASYQPAPQHAPSEVTGSVPRSAPQSAPMAPAPSPVVQAAPAKSSGNWHWEGGTAVSVKRGETLDVIARRHGVPAGAIAQANGLAANAAVYPGQRLVIPRYASSTVAAAPAQVQPVPAPVAQNAKVHIVGPGENLTAIARRYGKSLTALAAANKIPPYKMVRMGERIVIPGASAPMAAAPAPAPVATVMPQPTAPAFRPNERVVASQPTNTAHAVNPVPEKSEPESTAAAEPMGSAAGFRWPARGRVITAFGPRPTGQQNDGINLAVPEGTPVKASDDGVVAYSGNELKGYGNLVLVRHANGYVTAYAHASELLVKRGDKVKRGQVIAKSGQTGNVSSPQLHFEIRKGSTPVDPMQHLTGAT